MEETVDTVADLVGLTAADDRSSHGTIENPHRITIERASIGTTGQRFSASFREEVIVATSKTPLFDACRVLLARGIIGRLEMWRPGKATWDMQIDIERGAKLSVTEGAKIGPAVTKYSPHPGFPDADY